MNVKAFEAKQMLMFRLPIWFLTVLFTCQIAEFHFSSNKPSSNSAGFLNELLDFSVAKYVLGKRIILKGFFFPFSSLTIINSRNT